MGRGLGLNLMAKGYDLITVAHRSRAVVDELRSHGASEAETPAQIADRSDIVLMCVTGSAALQSVVFEENGILETIQSGQLVIDCSTGEPDTVTRMYEAFTARGVDFVDAPLARTPVEAEAGKLNTMVGGSSEAFERARPVLECFCENIFHMGGIGAGTRMKLINNLITMGQASLIAEAISACIATGVDLNKFYEVMSKGGGNSGIFQMIVPMILNEGLFKGMNFSIANAAKDLGYYNQMAENAGLEHRLGREVLAALTEAQQAGTPDSLVAELVLAAAQRNSLKIPTN
jgi:3-hydroxyisobutyrate dehydrogenase-like beta-hydroxyacid dehydrogenase